MSDNQTRPTTNSVDAFIAAIADPEKRADAQHLLELIEGVSGEPPVMWGPSIVGFGNVHYRYESGREGDTMAVGFSPRTQNITLYIAGGFEGIGPILARLGKYKTGKGCLYVKRLSDIDEDALVDLIQASLDRAAEINVAP